jgi:AcrR family transcriptional regulator
MRQNELIKSCLNVGKDSLRRSRSKYPARIAGVVGKRRIRVSANSSETKRGPGRPRAQAKSQVVTKLVEAAELLLRDCPHFELTERKIAAAAGTNEAMIHYYFGGKDGLLFEVMLGYYDGVIESLKALDAIDPYSKSVTRDIFKIMTDAYYEKHWIARMVIAEFARGSSAFKDMYMEKFGTQGVGLGKLQRVVDRLVACGVYAPQANTKYIGPAMYSMIIGPFVLVPFSNNPDLDFLMRDGWGDYAADLFDRQLRGTTVEQPAPPAR